VDLYPFKSLKKPLKKEEIEDQYYDEEEEYYDEEESQGDIMLQRAHTYEEDS